MHLMIEGLKNIGYEFSELLNRSPSQVGFFEINLTPKCRPIFKLI